MVIFLEAMVNWMVPLIQASLPVFKEGMVSWIHHVIGRRLYLQFDGWVRCTNWWWGVGGWKSFPRGDHYGTGRVVVVHPGWMGQNILECLWIMVWSLITVGL